MESVHLYIVGRFQIIDRRKRRRDCTPTKSRHERVWKNRENAQLATQNGTDVNEILTLHAVN